jgi:hypothetical protein
MISLLVCNRDMALRCCAAGTTRQPKTPFKRACDDKHPRTRSNPCAMPQGQQQQTHPPARWQRHIQSPQSICRNYINRQKHKRTCGARNHSANTASTFPGSNHVIRFICQAAPATGHGYLMVQCTSCRATTGRHKVRGLARYKHKHVLAATALVQSAAERWSVVPCHAHTAAQPQR